MSYGIFEVHAVMLKPFKVAYSLSNPLMSFFSYMYYQSEKLFPDMSRLSHHNIMSNNNISLTG